MSDDERSLQEIADQLAVDAVAKSMAEFHAEREAAKRAALPTPEQQLAQAKLRELVTEHALLHGVLPQSIRHVVRDAESVFEMRDGALVPKDGKTDPGDPLQPLSPSTWLQQLAKTDPYLFTTTQAGRAH